MLPPTDLNSARKLIPVAKTTNAAPGQTKPSIDLQRLADEIYKLIEQELRLEQERLGGCR